MKRIRSRMLLTISLVITVVVIFENVVLYIVVTGNTPDNDEEKIRAAVFEREVRETSKLALTTATVLATPDNTEKKVSQFEHQPLNISWSQKAIVYHDKKLSSLDNPREKSENANGAYFRQFKDTTGGQNPSSRRKISTFTTSRKAKDYDYWQEVGHVGETADEVYPFYTDESWPSPAKTTPLPPHVASLFPTSLSNKTLLFSPPHDEYHFKRFTDVLTDKNIDIFELLSRWNDVSLPFFSRKVGRLKLPLSEQEIPPVLRTCKTQPGEHFKKKHKYYRWRRNVECYNSTRELTPFELDGNHILFTMRTTARLHGIRLPLLFQTWLTNLNRSNVIIVTDGIDPTLQYRAMEAGFKYLVSVPGYEKLCDKAGDELSLMFLPENSHYEWLCHVDDDMYVNLDRLVSILALFKRDDPIYFGRAGTKPGEPRRVRQDAKLGTPGTPYNFAVGGMYCLNRALLNKARRWIGGRHAFKTMCTLTNEPEDVTVGFVVGVLLGLDLNQTELIHSHGNDLYSVNPAILKHQIGISYGFGSVPWGYRPNNVIVVPHRLFSLEDDPSQFLSLHCHYHRHIGWCVHRQRIMLKAKYPHTSISKS